MKKRASVRSAGRAVAARIEQAVQMYSLLVEALAAAGAALLEFRRTIAPPALDAQPPARRPRQASAAKAAPARETTRAPAPAQTPIAPPRAAPPRPARAAVPPTPASAPRAPKAEVIVPANVKRTVAPTPKGRFDSGEVPPTFSGAGIGHYEATGSAIERAHRGEIERLDRPQTEK